MWYNIYRTKESGTPQRTAESEKEMIKIYAEFANGDRKIFKGIDEERAMCNVIEYAEEHDTECTYYTEA